MGHIDLIAVAKWPRAAARFRAEDEEEEEEEKEEEEEEQQRVIKGTGTDEAV